MKRDIELFRDLLLYLEVQPEDELIIWCQTDFDTDKAYRHRRLLRESGFINRCLEITHSGHEVLDLIRDDDLWRKAKQVAREAQIESPPFGLLLDVARELLRQQLTAHKGV